MDKEERKFLAIAGKKVRTTGELYRCPHCGHKQWSIFASKDGKWRCEECKEVMSETDENIDRLVVEEEIDAYICPLCDNEVWDAPMNYTGQETVRGKNAVLCPTCHNYVNGLPLIHHGAHFEDWEPIKSGTDYFYFHHKPCQYETGPLTLGKIYACLIDNNGRIIFNVQCPSCKEVDAVKTHAGIKSQTIQRIFLSPNLKGRISNHSWDYS
jgi:Zn finger protein HypA/HybF involved in hydrogenase expression